jgi:hypothetical protein
MEAIPQLIFNRLARRERVILPGIGTLYTESDPAAVDASGRLAVPHVRVLFDASEPGGEVEAGLPELVAADSGLPFAEIRPQVDRWLSKLKSTATDGEWGIDGVVRLTRRADGAQQVEPSPELNAWLNPLGAAPVLLPGIQPSKEEKTKTQHVTPGSRRKKRRGRGWAFFAMILILLGAGCYYGYVRGGFDSLIGRFQRQNTPSPLPIPDSVITESPIVTDTSSSDSLPQTEPVGGMILDSLPRTEPVIDSSVVAYHLVGGVFSTRENAERFIRESAPDPQRAVILPMTSGKFMVSIGRYTDKGSADHEAALLRSRIPDIWVSKRK